MDGAVVADARGAAALPACCDDEGSDVPASNRAVRIRKTTRDVLNSSLIPGDV